MQREDALDALPERHLAHRERRPRAAAAEADDDALEHLHAFLVAFAHPHVHADGVADRMSAARASCDRSIVSIAFIIRSFFTQLSYHAPLLVVERRTGQQIRPLADRAAQRFTPPPRFDARMVPRHEHVGHRQPRNSAGRVKCG